MHQHKVIQLLRAYSPSDSTEIAFREQMIEFVGNNADFGMRSNAAGHLTASGWIINAGGTHALLIHHAKLDRWLQPGGHIEPNDISLAAAALREVREETGLQDVLLSNHILFDLDIHAIPARGDEAKHLHYDCRFLFRAGAGSTVAISAESHGFEWVPIADLVSDHIPQSLRRMAVKFACGRSI